MGRYGEIRGDTGRYGEMPHLWREGDDQGPKARACRLAHGGGGSLDEHEDGALA